MLAQGLHKSGYRRCFLADCHIDAVYGLAGLVVLALVDDCVDCNCGLAYLTVADDELALASTYGNHRVDGLDTGLEGLLHRLTIYNAGSLSLEGEAD